MTTTKNPIIIIIDGLIGTGKTTTINLLEQAFNNQGIKFAEKYEQHFQWVFKDIKNNRHYDWLNDVNSLSRSFIKGHTQQHYFA